MRSFAVAGLLALAIPLLAGCTSDPAAEGHAGFPVEASYSDPSPDSVSGFEFVAQLTREDGTAYPSGGGNFVLGDYVFGSALNEGFFIANVSDPANPVLVYDAAEDSPTPFSRKAEVMAHPDGRRTLVLATQSNGLHLWDVTDPTAPVFAAVVEFEANHNIEVVPGTQYVFNLPSKGKNAANTLVDIQDPFAPRPLGDYGAYGCHGLQFHGTLGDADFRGYCAAIDRTEIWDMSRFDPTKRDFNITLMGVVEGTDSPIVGSPVANPPIPTNPLGLTSTPARNLHHFAVANEAGTVLIIGDEHRGGGSPGACVYNDPVTGTSTPLGALWFYDITNPADPVLLSWISPPTVAPPVPGAPEVPTVPEDPTKLPLSLVNQAYALSPGCTAHFGTLVPGEEKIVIAWYSAGVLLIDFSDPAAPVILDQYQPDGIDVWNARVWNGYVFTGDITRGMDVLKLV